MTKKNYVHFKKNFPYLNALSVEELVGALESPLSEVNNLLMALSYKKRVDVFIDMEDTDTLTDIDAANKACFGVSIRVDSDLSQWEWLPSTGTMEEL